MSVHAGPKISASGISMSIDAANIKSYSRSGTTLSDVSTNGNHGSASGVTFSESAMTFNGTSSYVSIPNTLSMRPASEMTVSMWARASSITTGWCNLLGQNPYSGGYLVFLETGGTYIRALHYVGGVEYRCSTTEPILTTNYKHIVFTFKTGDAIRSYFNGVASTTVSIPSGSFTYNTSNPFLMGSGAGAVS